MNPRNGEFQPYFFHVVASIEHFNKLSVSLSQFASPHEEALLSRLSAVLKGLKSELAEPASLLSEDIKAPLEEHDIESVWVRLSELSHCLGVLYDVFPEVSSLVVSSTLYTFIKGSFEEIFWQNLNEATIAFHHVSNYETYDISKLFSSKIQESGLYRTIPDLGPVLRLPRVDYRRPLMWPNLLHEMGHVIDRKFIDSSKLAPEVAADKRDNFRRTQAQLREITADIIATDILGPAYLCSFIMHTMSQAPGTLNSDTYFHPSPKDRVDVIESLINRNDMTEEVHRLVNMFKCAANAETEVTGQETLICRSCNHPIETPAESLLNVEQMKEQVVEEFSKLEIGIPSYQKKEYKLSELADSLLDGRIISACHIETHEKITEMVKIIEEKEQQGQQIGEEGEALMAMINERPTGCAEIINAAWIAFLRNSNNKDLWSKLEDDENLEQNLQSEIDKVIQIENLIEKSIQISEVHSILI
ncbi:MAG: M48 family metalloprotease [Thermoleophilia bacterium]